MKNKSGALQPDPTAIGDVAEPPFVRLPDPATVFALRAMRLEHLAPNHTLQPYLDFLGHLCACQHHVQKGLPEPDMPTAETFAQAREHAMPPLDRLRFTTDAACDATLDGLFNLAADLQMPDTARAALDRVRAADSAARDEMVRSVLADSIPVEQMAEHVFVAAALQVHFARVASRLDGERLVPVDDGVCPTCGGPPVASAIVGWQGAHGARFCTCSLCATQWHVVRIKCVLCNSTKGIAYQALDGGNENIKAETCENCHGFVKVMVQTKDPVLDPVADDVASLGLDLLLRESGYKRGAVNPFLLGY
jgi:FdhE protein